MKSLVLVKVKDVKVKDVKVKDVKVKDVTWAKAQDL